MTETFLQNYGWALISFLGGLLVVLMLVLGANLLLGTLYRDTARRQAVVKATGRKCGFAFAALLAFGAVVYVAFPLFFNTAFLGGNKAWWALTAILAAQWTAAVLCRFNGNLPDNWFFRFFLMLLGFLGPFILGTTLGTFFTGSEFVVDKTASPRVGTWTGAWHGLEALTRPHAMLMGLTVVSLSVILGALYVIRIVDDHTVRKRMRRSVRVMSVLFLVLAIVWFVLLLLRSGFSVDGEGIVSAVEYKYLMNFLHHTQVQIVFLVGAALFVLGLYYGVFTKSRRKGFWYTSAGTVIAMMGVFFLAGYNKTAYYPSLTNLQDSLTIRNSAAGIDTLRTLFWVSFALLLVLAGLGFLWHWMDRRKILVQELESKNK